MIFEEQIKVKYSEMDYKLALKPSSLLNFLQDLASANAEKLGFGSREYELIDLDK